MARLKQTYAGERRSIHLGVQLTPTERAELQAAAAASGATLSQYVRELCLRRTVAPSAVAGTRRNPEAKRVLNELSAIGNNLNQLARVANTVHAAPQHEELKAAIEVLKSTITHVLTL
jgi:hypothetical protein